MDLGTLRLALEASLREISELFRHVISACAEKVPESLRNGVSVCSEILTQYRRVETEHTRPSDLFIKLLLAQLTH
jgi:hypothetical protein